MNQRLLLYSFFLFSCLNILAQERDSTYVKAYEQPVWVRVFTDTKALMLSQDDITYSPNNSYSLGVGLGLSKVLGFNIQYAQNLFHLKDKVNLKTSITDFQLHTHGNRFLIDLYYQKYTGFYTEKKEKQYTLFPNLSTQQIGIEGTYVWNTKKFSAKAAFEQSERQLKSAGSWLSGSGLYWHRILQEGVADKDFENLQWGVNVGYAYSWVPAEHWLLTGALMMGLNFGNQTKDLQKLKFKVYPSINTRFSFTYLKKDWAVSVLSIFNTKTVYLNNKAAPIRIITPDIQLSFVKHFHLKKEHFLYKLPSLK
ncbi:hypothetical protein RCZ04_05770 [Capnocytophaga sp. HP1101]